MTRLLLPRILPYLLIPTDSAHYLHGGVGVSNGAGPRHDFNVWLDGHVGVVTAPYELGDSNAQQFLEALAFAAERVAIIAVDLSGTRRCDPRGLAPLLMALRYSDVAGGEVRIVLGFDPAIRRAFFDSGLQRLFRTFDSVTAALLA